MEFKEEYLPPLLQAISGHSNFADALHEKVTKVEKNGVTTFHCSMTYQKKPYSAFGEKKKTARWKCALSLLAKNRPTEDQILVKVMDVYNLAKKFGMEEILTEKIGDKFRAYSMINGQRKSGDRYATKKLAAQKFAYQELAGVWADMKKRLNAELKPQYSQASTQERLDSGLSCLDLNESVCDICRMHNQCRPLPSYFSNCVHENIEVCEICAEAAKENKKCPFCVFLENNKSSSSDSNSVFSDSSTYKSLSIGVSQDEWNEKTNAQK